MPPSPPFCPHSPPAAQNTSPRPPLDPGAAAARSAPSDPSPPHPAPTANRPPPLQSGTAEPGYGNYGYYGNPAAAGYFGGMYPSQADLALYRMNPSAGSLANRASIRTTRYNSRYPYDVSLLENIWMVVGGRWAPRAQGRGRFACPALDRKSGVIQGPINTAESPTLPANPFPSHPIPPTPIHQI
jgi:hypothetical protein